MKRNTQTTAQAKTPADKSNTTKSGDQNKRNQNAESLMKVFHEELKDIYGAEKQLIAALPEMAKAADDENLKQAFEDHLEQTKEQAKRIEQIFGLLSVDREEKKCKAMAGLIEEGRDVLKEYEQGPIRDTALIIGAQKIEHYEIAAYGSLCELAEVLGKHRIANILDTTLQEEEEADSLLTEISESVNDAALDDSAVEAKVEDKEKSEVESQETEEINA